MNEPMPGAEPEQHADTERTYGAGSVAVPDDEVGGAPEAADAPEAGEASDTSEAPESAEALEVSEDDPGAPRPLGVGMEPTGHPPVDAQLRRLEDADHLAVSGHLEVYEDVHRGLRDTLTALDRHEPRS